MTSVVSVLLVLVVAVTCVRSDSLLAVLKREDTAAQEECSGALCYMYCEYGNVLDSQGCPICQCNEPPHCGPVCAMECEFGMMRDSTGCRICECIEYGPVS